MPHFQTIKKSSKALGLPLYCHTRADVFSHNITFSLDLCHTSFFFFFCPENVSESWSVYFSYSPVSGRSQLVSALFLILCCMDMSPTSRISCTPSSIAYSCFLPSLCLQHCFSYYLILGKKGLNICSL